MRQYNDIMSWTAMINGYVEHSFSYEATELFEKLPTVGLKPDPVTFIGALTACSHARLVELGFNYFNSMSKGYQISPSKEHYDSTRRKKRGTRQPCLRKPVESLIFPFFLVQEPDLEPRNLFPCWKIPDLLCLSSPVRRLLLLAVSFSPALAAGLLPPCSSGFSWKILVLDRFVSLVRDLSARFCGVR
ncbi:hypothetical protein SLEP1_g12264 [Rubroshorea leprosula]|uniref:Pentatricopeptide repeat-containing protein n=1 Tax=Rubroshorea leprosula TaxID=152421 RepID=A0AAV5IGF7_9ROSI|nr:hypothetical protein SLEP1_g12264 [Rubroshorea leprosula]